MESFFKLTMAVVQASAFIAVAAVEPATASKPSVYFGTYTGAKSQGIYLSHFETRSGALTEPELVAEAKNPSFLALHPKLQVIYSVGEVDEFNGKRTGGISAYRIEPGTGRLVLLNQQPSGGTGPCHLSVDRTGGALFAANYGSGSISSMPLKADGSLGEPLAPIQHTGSSVNKARQTGPHAHFILPDPRDRFVLACDLGIDKVLAYKFEPRDASLTPAVPPFARVKPGAGARHFAFHPNGKFLFVINELDSTISTFSYTSRNGAMRMVSNVHTLPVDFKGPSSCAEVVVHPSGKFVYASNRGHDSVAIFSVDVKTGQLLPAGFQSTGGKTPRHITLDPSGGWLLASNQDTHNVCVFRVNPANGGLFATGQGLEIGSPVCALFVPAKR